MTFTFINNDYTCFEKDNYYLIKISGEDKWYVKKVLKSTKRTVIFSKTSVQVPSYKQNLSIQLHTIGCYVYQFNFKDMFPEYTDKQEKYKMYEIKYAFLVDPDDFDICIFFDHHKLDGVEYGDNIKNYKLLKELLRFFSYNYRVVSKEVIERPEDFSEVYEVYKYIRDKVFEETGEKLETIFNYSEYINNLPKNIIKKLIKILVNQNSRCAGFYGFPEENEVVNSDSDSDSDSDDCNPPEN